MKKYIIYFVLLISYGCNDNSSNVVITKSDDDKLAESLIGVWSNGPEYRIQFNSNMTFIDSSFTDSLSVYSTGMYEVINGVIQFKEVKYSHSSKIASSSFIKGFSRTKYPLTVFIQNDSLNTIHSEILLRLDSGNVGVIGKWRSDYWRYDVLLSKSTPQYEGYGRTDYEFKADSSTLIERWYNNIDSVNIRIQDWNGTYQYNPPRLHMVSTGWTRTIRVNSFNNKLILLYDMWTSKLARIK